MIGATVVIWGFALSILGVNISARSKDKRVAAGIPSAGLIGDLVDRLRKSKA